LIAQHYDEKKTTKVLIIDDHPITIEGFERALDYIAE